MRYESVSRYKPTLFKIAFSPLPKLKLTECCLNSHTFLQTIEISLLCIIFKVLILMKSFLTYLGHITCMDYHEKNLT